MKLTREQAIAEHRKMWNWIADETEKRGYKVSKRKYLYEKRNCHDPLFNVFNDCFCCEYALSAIIKRKDYMCSVCPIDWGTDDNGIKKWCLNSLYQKWNNATNPIYAAKLARQIANLPERTDNIPTDEIRRGKYYAKQS